MCFRWKFNDPDESSNPGVREGRFKQRDNELEFLFDGRTATLAAPTDALAPALFLVRQDLIVGSLCATVQLGCERKAGGRTYRCEPTLLPP